MTHGRTNNLRAAPTAAELLLNAANQNLDPGVAGLVLLAKFHGIAAARQPTHQYGRISELLDEPAFLSIAASPCER